MAGHAAVSGRRRYTGPQGPTQRAILAAINPGSRYSVPRFIDDRHRHDAVLQLAAKGYLQLLDGGKYYCLARKVAKPRSYRSIRS